MSDPPGSGMVWALILAAAAAGPATALLYGSDVLSLGPVSSLWHPVKGEIAITRQESR